MKGDLTLSAGVALAALVGLMARGAWRGYRRGPLRQLSGPAALTAGLAAAWALGPEAGHAALQGTAFPWILRGMAGMCILGTTAGLATYSLCWWLGRRPEGAEEAESPVAGTVVGCWTGMMYFGAALLLVFSWASIEETLASPNGPTPWIVKVRNDLVNSGLASELKDWSPVSDRHRTLIGQTRRLMTDSAARRRLMAMPEIRALASHPSVYQAWEDKNVRKLMNDNDLSGLIDHPKVRAVLADEQFQKEAEKIDLVGLIGKALEKPQK
ncbi:MAG: hypothetical protein ACO3ND_06340 [Opitutales bacterium]